MAQKNKDIGQIGGRDGGRAGSGGFMARSKAASSKSNSAQAKTKSASATAETPAAKPPPLPGPVSNAALKNAKKAASKSVPPPEPILTKEAKAPSPIAAARASEERFADFNDGQFGDAGNTSQRRPAQRRPAGPVRERLAANDDVPSIGGLIYALEQKPSFDAFKYATIASIGWVVIGLGFGWLSLATELASGVTFFELLAKPATFLTLAGIVVPVAVIWFLAVLAWRADELRLRSSTMTEVAVRLAEPDRLAEQSVASLGQAVRRQVSFMNDAVSRALGRAGELEALVHSEVASLEHSYEENERKIRGLINELSNERTALVGTGDDFAVTLRTMGEEVPALIDKLSSQQSKLAGIIASAGDNLTALESSLETSADRLEGSLGTRTEQLQTVLEDYTSSLDTSLDTRTSDMRAMLEHHTSAIDTSVGEQAEGLHAMLEDHSSTMGSAIGKHASDMGGMLGDRTDDMRKLLGDYTTALADALGSRTEQMEETFSEHMVALDASIGQRTDDLQSVFEEYSRALDSTLANRAEDLNSQLIDRTRTLDNAFNHRLQLFDDSIQRSTLAIDEAVGERALALTSALDSHAVTFRETITQQASELDESLVHGINAVRRSSENISRQSLKAIEGLAGQSDLLKNVSENLLGQISSVTNRFDTQTQSIMSAANALETANFKIDATLRTRHNDLSQTLDRMSGKADEFGKFIEGYSSSIEGSLNDAELRARAAAEELRAGALSQQSAVIADFDQLRTSADQQSSRALEDLRKRFATVSDELTTQMGAISTTVDDTTGDLRRRVASASDELSTHMGAISTTVDSTTGDLRRKLSTATDDLATQMGTISTTVDDTTGELRRRTADATSQIAQERERLKSELAAIPATTREGTETMRRALQDQLKALERLSDISKTHVKGHDVRPPLGASGAMANAPQGLHQGAAVAPSRGLSSLSTSVARELESRGQPRGAPSNRADPVGGGREAAPMAGLVPAAHSAHGAAAGLVPAPAATHAPGAQGRGDGWSLGDLLHRASFDEVGSGIEQPAPAAPPPVAAGNQSFAAPPVAQPEPQGGGVDIAQIARAIDPAAAAQVWDRLRSGERGFLSKDMYTAEGRIVFDDIGYRCQTDGGVRDSVLSFLGDFEHSLREGEKADPSGRQVQELLLSETGRVYLFLAHVSGRLG